jgi:hypothetical protein
MAKSRSVSMTIAQLCSHFEQRELCLANTWRSYSTKNIYKSLPKAAERRITEVANGFESISE